MASFKDKFITILEQDEVSPERMAAAAMIEPGSEISQYDVPAPRTDVNVEHKHRQLEELKTWIKKIEDFVDFLNEPKAESIQSKLHAAPTDSLFETIASAEKKTITRIAADLSSFAQDLNGYLISSNS